MTKKGQENEEDLNKDFCIDLSWIQAKRSPNSHTIDFM